MKKIVCFVLSLVLLFGCLSGCRPNAQAEDPTEGENPTEGEKSTEATPAPQTAPMLPQETMPTKPESDYQLPPGEKPGSGNVQTH